MIDKDDYKKLRKELELTQMELAAAIGEEEARIWLLENGFIHRVNAGAVERIDKKLLDLCERKELDSIGT